LINAFINASKIKNDSLRLARFDAIANQAKSLTNNLDNDKNTGDWQLQSKNNPLDDSKTVVAALQANQGTNSYNEKPVLVARCQSNKITFYINWGEYLGDNARVTFRIDKNETKTTTWSLSTDSKATFFPRHTIDFLRKLEHSGRFVAQITPYDSNPITAVFNTSGADKIIPKILGCSK